MAKKIKYRLQVLLVIKERAKKAKEIELARAVQKLNEERKKLEVLEEEKRAIEKRVEEEKEEMRHKVASGNAVMRDPQGFLNFLRKLKEDIEAKEQAIEEQKDVIKQAEKYLQRCRSAYVLAAQELNMMEKHKELWLKKQAFELGAAENKMLNELGNVIHQMNKLR